MSDSHIKIRETINEYNRCLYIISEYEEMDGICKLSKKRLSELFELSYTATLKRLNLFVKYGIITLKDGGIMRTGVDVIQATPISLLPKMLKLIADRPDTYNSFKHQAELLRVSLNDIQAAWGYYSYFFGSKHPGETEMRVLEESGINR